MGGHMSEKTFGLPSRSHKRPARGLRILSNFQNFVRRNRAYQNRVTASLFNSQKTRRKKLKTFFRPGILASLPGVTVFQNFWEDFNLNTF